MLKYLGVALALKAFSTGAPMRRLYRIIGNRSGGSRRSSGGMPAFYIDRLHRTLRLCRQHGIVKDGDRILELGTGWLHWEALTIRLFYDVEAVLYDVWDNRQLGGLLNYVGQLKSRLGELGLTEPELKRAQATVEKVLSVSSFDELYRKLGFSYHVESSGSMARYKEGEFRLVVSAGVLEHVYREAVPTLIAETHRILQPGGWAVHSIDSSDHLAHYDLSVSRKLYLQHSERMWKALYENDVQYINRIQRGEWMRLFRENRFDLIEEESREIDISGLRVGPRYEGMEERDLKTTVIKVALRK